MSTPCLRCLATGRWFLTCLSWLLLLSAAAVNGQHGASRTLSGSEGLEFDDFVKVVEDNGGRRPFLALKDTVRAASQDVQRLYEQSGQVSAIAYLLFAAAVPLTKAEGSSNALLPYLTPTVLRLYTSQPGRCSSPLSEDLYDLSLRMYGSPELQSCHYDLYTALDSTFSWVRDNIALRAQEVPEQPLASAMWPDSSLYPDLELTAAVTDALSHPDKLGDTAELIATSCQLPAGDFAALVSPISTVLQRLHADLPLLQHLAEDLHATHWTPVNNTVDKTRRRELLEQLKKRYTNPHHIGPEVGLHDGPDFVAAAAATGDANPADTAPRHHRRSALTLPSNFNYSLPPSNFVLAAPSAMPRLLISMVFHIMLYQDGSSIGPAKVDQSLSYVQRLVSVANVMAKPTNFQFSIKEVRNDPDTYPYLLLSDRATWLKIPLQNCTGTYCFSSSNFMYKNVHDFPRSINVFVASDSTSGVPLGYAYVPGSDLYPDSGHAFMSWDSLSADGANSLKSYDDGPNTLLHELFHHLGLEHPFDYSVGADGSCVDGDYVIDTPASFRPISSSGFFATAQSYCMELFWGQYGGSWEAAYGRWSTNLGIPETDMNAWADSCPALAGYDELGNYMTYNTPVCFAALGHFTPAQAQRAHFMAAELNPIAFAWGQYYAQNSAPPPPQMSPPPEFVNNSCRATARSVCACKSVWNFNGTSYSYCDRIWSNSTLSCEVLDPSTCADCTDSSSQCILPCAGSPRVCKRPPVPGTRMPPPPPPRPPSPPPAPPPPPPRAIPSECRKTRSGCDCRSTWSYRSGYYGYCASPDRDPILWCQVSSTCPTFNNSNPYQYCAANLTEPYCGGRIYFTTTRVPPAPPASPSPPPDMRPRPPPSPPATPAAPVATVRGRFTINANCALLNTNGTALRASVLVELAASISVPSSYISLTSMACGSILVDYLVTFPSGATLVQVKSASDAANRFSSTVSSSFTSRWGSVTQSSSTGVDVLQPNELCTDSSVKSSYCPPAPSSPPPPAPPSKKSFPWLWVIVGAGAGGLVLIAVATVAIIVVMRRNRRVTDASMSAQATQQRGQPPAGNQLANVAVQAPGPMPYPPPYPNNAFGAAPVPYNQQQPAYPPQYMPPPPPQYQPPPPQYQQPPPYQPYPQQPYR